MLIQEAHIIFKVSLDKLDSSVYPELAPEVIDIILRINEQRFIKQRYSGNNFRREGFEVTQKRTDDLRTVVKEVTLNAIETSDNLEYYTFDLTSTSDYWFLIKARAYNKVKICGMQYGSTINDSKNTTSFYKSKKVHQVQIDDIEVLLEDPFNSPDVDYPLLTFEAGGMIRLYTDSKFTVKQLKVSYIKEPLKVDINAVGVNNPTGYTNTFNTPSHTHQEIIDMAVNWTLENLEAIRYRTSNEELTKME
jgi:hypothetical protein